jgi:uncharacterized protein
VSRPFSVPTSELFRHQGVRHPVTLAGRIDDVALSTVRLSGDDVVADLVLEAHGDTVTAAGTVVARWVGDCRRCLDETGGDVMVELREVFEPDPVDGETYELGRDEIDLGPAVREALALALPLAPLCGEDCPGPDPGAHPVATEDDAAAAGADAGADAGAAAEPRRDPRWGALDALQFDDDT